MAIKLTKKKAEVPIALQQDVQTDLEKQIDLVGALQEDAAKVAAKIKKLQEELKPFKDAMKTLETMVAEMDGDDDQAVEEAGTRFRLEAGKKGTSREITNMARVREIMGDELFMSLAEIKLKDVDDYLTPPQKEEVLKTSRTTRTIKVLPLASAVVKKAA